MPSGSSGRVWSTCLVFWSSDVPFLSLKGTHSPTVGFPCDLRVPFLLLFCIFFQTSFLTAIKPKSSQSEGSQTTKNHKNMQKKVTETHPQSGPVKRLSLAGAKPLKLTTLTTLSAVLPQAQRFQMKPKRELKSRFRAPKSGKNHTKEPLATPRKQPTGSF